MRVNKKHLAQLERRLEIFLAELTEPMGRAERRRWAGQYVRGLLLDGERKSVQPMAARLEGADEQALNQFLNQSPWDAGEVMRRAARLVTGELSAPQLWLIDETSFPKAGAHSVAVARQYCGALGKIANCQVAVSLHWSGEGESCPLGWRLYVPESWFADRERARKAGLPPDLKHRTKSALALELIDEALSWGVPPLPITADSLYGKEFQWRVALRERQLEYVVAVESSLIAFAEDPRLRPIPGGHRHVPRDQLPPVRCLAALAQSLPSSAWKTLTWRRGTKGPMRSRFAYCQIWAAHDWKKTSPPARAPEWLLVEWPEGKSAPTDYWLGHCKASRPTLRWLVRCA